MSRKNVRKGYFVPQNPEKYDGDVKDIYYRSSWERTFMRKLDEHSDVLVWSSEPFSINYSFMGKPHRYFPDFLIKKKKKDGGTEIILIEIKPFKETKRPEQPTRKTKRYLEEEVTYRVNQKKWTAAEEFCRRRGWKFQVITERDIKFKS